MGFNHIRLIDLIYLKGKYKTLFKGVLVLSSRIIFKGFRPTVSRRETTKSIYKEFAKDLYILYDNINI